MNNDLPTDLRGAAYLAASNAVLFYNVLMYFVIACTLGMCAAVIKYCQGTIWMKIVGVSALIIFATTFALYCHVQISMNGVYKAWLETAEDIPAWESVRLGDDFATAMKWQNISLLGSAVLLLLCLMFFAGWAPRWVAIPVCLIAIAIVVQGFTLTSDWKVKTIKAIVRKSG